MDNPLPPQPIRQWLQTALSHWQEQGILTSEQVGRIQALYPAQTDAPGIQERVFYVLGAMAAFLFGAALILAIGYNWNEMAREAKLGTMLAGTALVHGVGFWFHKRMGWPLAAEIAHFLGSIVYGAGIWLVAQAYHMDAHYPDGMWWWALGVLPLVLFSSTLLYHLLYVALLAVWCGMEVIGFQSPIDSFFWGIGGLPHGAFTLPLLVVPGFFWAYRKSSPILLGLYLPLIAWWIFLQALAWHANNWTAFWVGGVGSILLLLAQVHRPGNQMAIPHRLWGTLLTVGPWLFISSNSFWNSFGYISYGTNTNPYYLWNLNGILCAIILTTVVAILVLGWLRSQRNAAYKLNLSRLWLPVVLAIGTVVFGYLALLGEKMAIPAMILGNLFILAMAVMLVRVGVMEERLRPFAGGVICFLLWTLVRYIDLFDASWGMLGAAGIFTLAGIGLLLVGKFWVSTSRIHNLQKNEPVDFAQPASMVWPKWVNQGLAWTGAHWQAVLGTSVALQLGVVGGMVALEQVSMTHAQTVYLKVVPVDPRDFFRGDYVVLDYDIMRELVQRDLQGDTGTVYVKLAPPADGKSWTPLTIGKNPPREGVYMAGKIKAGFESTVEFGIEAYYVQESEGKKWEQAIRKKKVLAKILVSPEGKARLVDLIEESTLN